MTTISSETIKCAVCGTDNQVNIVMASNSFGPCDIDFRPALSLRYDCLNSIQRCACCNYVAFDLSENGDENIQEVLDSKEYKTILGLSMHYQVKDYLLRAIIDEHYGRKKEVATDRIFAAWLMEDLTLTFLEQAGNSYYDWLSKTEPVNASPIAVIRMLDIFRRAGDFDRVTKYATRYTVPEDNRFYHVYKYVLKLTDEHNVGMCKADAAADWWTALGHTIKSPWDDVPGLEGT